MSERPAPSPADLLDDGFVVQFEGRVLKFAPKDHVEVLGRYEVYLEQQAWQALARAQQVLSPQQYQDQAEGIRRDVVSGVWGFGSRYWVESLKNLAHQKKLVTLMAQFHQPDLDPAVIDRMYRDPEKVRELVGKVFGVDPNALTPRHSAAAA